MSRISQSTGWSLLCLMSNLLIPASSFCPPSYRISAHNSQELLSPFARRVALCTLSEEAESSPAPSASLAAAPPPEAAVDDSFHADLKKVLAAREPTFQDLKTQRRGKPRLVKGDEDGAEKAVRMLKHMVRIGVATEASFQMVFRSLLKRGRMQWLGMNQLTCAANELEILLGDLERYYADNNDISSSSNFSLSVDTYNMVLEAYANCANSRSNYRYAEKAEGLLRSRLGGDGAAPASSLAHVVRAWAWQQGNRDDARCAQRAADYLALLEKRTEDGGVLSEARGWALEGLSKAVGGAALADEVFRKRAAMSIPTPMADYTNVILAWAKDPKEGSILRATEHLESMTRLFLAGELEEDPEHIAFSSVISGWTQLDRPDKAEELLWLMEKEVRPKAKTMKPSVYTYNNVCHGFIKHNSKITKESLKSIANIVRYMEENYGEQPLIKPDSYTYNTLIKAWTLSDQGQTVEQMEEILDRMEAVLKDGKVSNKNFNVVLNAYAKSKEPDAAEKALKLLERMKASKLVDPDTITYTTVLACLANCRAEFAVDKSMELLAELESTYEETRKESTMPNARTFSMVISTLAKAPDRVKDARALLDRLIRWHRDTDHPSLRPTVHAYNHVINCASAGSGGGRAEAFKIAARTYQEVRESPDLAPDSYTYAFWFKACNQLLPGTSALYEKFLLLSFSQCRKEGMVSREVLNRLRQGHLTYAQLAGILKCEPQDVAALTVDDLQPSWTRNVKPR